MNGDYLLPKPCEQCNCNFHHYDMVILPNKLWLKIAHTLEFLCVNCIEQRLGRKLTPKDFPNKEMEIYRHGNKSNIREIMVNVWHFEKKGWI